MENFGESYALTLREWRRRFLEQWPQVEGLGFDASFRRNSPYAGPDVTHSGAQKCVRRECQSPIRNLPGPTYLLLSCRKCVDVFTYSKQATAAVAAKLRSMQCNDRRLVGAYVYLSARLLPYCTSPSLLLLPYFSLRRGDCSLPIRSPFTVPTSR